MSFTDSHCILLYIFIPNKSPRVVRMTNKAEKNLDRNQFYNTNDLTSDYFQSVTRSKHPVWCRCLWVFIIIGSLGFTAYMVYELLHNYLQYNSFNQASMVWQAGAALPALTICNVNVVNFTKFAKMINNASDLEPELNSFIKEISIAMKTTEEGSYFEMSPETEARAEKLDKVTNKDGQTINILSDLHSIFENYFLGNGESHPYMEFASRYRALPSEPPYITTELGECLVLNDDQTFVQTLGGVKGGFTIDLDTRLSEYIHYTPLSGFMLYLRNPYEIVLTDHGGIYLPPGKEHFVRIQEEKITRLQDPYGICEDHYSPLNETHFQTVRECIQFLYFVEIVSTCRCVPWYLVDAIKKDDEAFENWINQTFGETLTLENIDSKMCSFVAQSVCDIVVIDELAKINIKNICKEPCQYKDWPYILISGNFPVTKGYFREFLRDYVNMNGFETVMVNEGGQTDTGSDNDTDTETDNDTKSDNNTHTNTVTTSREYLYAKRNFVRLHIFYDDIKDNEITQTKVYELSNFIAEFGGVTDLLIGLSFFTIFQLFEIFIAYFVFKCCQGKKHGSEDENGGANMSENVVYPNQGGSNHVPFKVADNSI